MTEKNCTIKHYIEREILYYLLKCSDAELKELYTVLKKFRSFYSKNPIDLIK